MMPLLEGWPTKAKEEPFYCEVSDPAGHQTSISMSWGKGLMPYASIQF